MLLVLNLASNVGRDEELKDSLIPELLEVELSLELFGHLDVDSLATMVKSLILPVHNS